MPTQETTKKFDANRDACYHWSHTMAGGAPREDRKYGFAIAFGIVWFFVFLISWAAYSAVH